MARMMDVYVWERHGGRQAEQRLHMIDEVLADGLVRCLIVHADLECPADDEVISAWKHVSVLTIQVLQAWLLRRQHRQLALDRSHLGIAPHRNGTETGAVDDDVLRQ